MSGRVEGFADAFAALNNLKSTVAKNVGKRSLIPAAEALKDGAVANAPEDTGAYKESYRVDKSARRRGTAVEVHVRADDVAAAAIEYGTSDTPVHGTFRRTADQMEPQLVDMVGETLKREVEAAAARAAKRAAKG